MAVNKYVWTDEMLEWIGNLPEGKWEQKAKMFNEKFGTDYPSYAIRHKRDRVYGAEKHPHRYSDEEIEWMVEHQALQNNEFAREFNKKFGTNLSVQAIILQKHSQGIVKYKVYKPTEEDIEYITMLRESCDWSTVAKIFSKRIGREFSPKVLNAIYSRNGGYTQERHKYTYEEDEWIRCNIEHMTLPKLEEEFNKKFSADVKQISRRVYRLGLCKGDSYIPHNRKDVGETIEDSNGYIWVKIHPTLESLGYTRRTVPTNSRRVLYKRRSHIVWEEHFGEVPEGCRLLHLDGDKQNDYIENLACVEMKYIRQLQNSGWLAKGEVTKTGIKYWDLMNKIKELKKSG